VGQRILVVEDNELNLKLFCDLLRAHGYETEPVRDGREALERARAFAPDLVVMDIQMPHVSGLELIELMKRDDGLKRTPIMAVTAYAAKGDEERIRDAGAEGYVSKPISVLRFVEAVAGLLGTAGERTGDAAAAAAVKAAEGSEAIEAEVKAESPAAEARAIEAAAGSEEVVKDAAAAAESAENPEDDRHSRESGNRPSDAADEEGKPDPRSSPG
jgi:two-component system, cell cycle response regulator DivK